MREQPAASDNLGDLRRQARFNTLRLKIAQQNEALAALRRSGCRDSLEDFYDPANFFDPRDYLFDVPRGFGGAIPTTRNDRDEGRDFPIFRTEQELAVIRGAARLLTSASPIAVGILTTLTNYVIGNGFQYAVTSRAGSDNFFANVASRVIDEFLEENGWVGDLDRELFQRSRIDGEYFLGLWHVGNGHVQARAVEPDQVTEPSNKTGIEAWLGCTGSLGGAASLVSSWTFGVHTDDTDAQAIHGYYVQWTNRDTEWDYFPGGNEPITPPDGAARWLEHAKLNVVRSVKRGLSDFYSIQGNLDLARRVLRNMGEGSAVQAAIAWIQEAAPGVTQAQTSSATLARADARYTTTSAQGSRTHTAQQYDPATILKVPNGQKYLPGPLGSQNAPSFITAAEALLRTVAVRWSLPENLVTGTAENNNFASSLVAESPFVKFAESQQQFYAQRDKRTLRRVLWFAWSAGRFGDVPWSLVERSVEITVTPPQIEVRDPEKETRVREMLNKAGILSRKTWSAQEGLDFEQEQKNLAAEAQTAPHSEAKTDGKPEGQSPVESIEAEGGRDFDPSKHPRGGNAENTGQFSTAAGPTNRAAEIVKQAAAIKGAKQARDKSPWQIQIYRPDIDGPPRIEPIPLYRPGEDRGFKLLADKKGHDEGQGHDEPAIGDRLQRPLDVSGLDDLQRQRDAESLEKIAGGIFRDEPPENWNIAAMRALVKLRAALGRALPEDLEDRFLDYIKNQQETLKLRREFENTIRHVGPLDKRHLGEDVELSEVVLDVAQIGLDITGVIDPTPASDGASAIISLGRGNLTDAGISAVAMIPYFGDLAKIGKLGAYPKKLAKAIELALKNEKPMVVLRPVLKQLQRVVERIPLEKLPDRLREPLEGVKKQLDGFFGKIEPPNESRPRRQATRKTSRLKPGPNATESIPARNTKRSFTDAEHEQINKIGRTHGCHSCGSKLAGTPSGNFVPDHQPPTALLLPGMSQRLYPQCIKCSRIQGGQVRAWQQ